MRTRHFDDQGSEIVDRGLSVVADVENLALGARVKTSTQRAFDGVVYIREASCLVAVTVHGDGNQTRCFTYVDDTVEGTLRAGLDSRAEGKIFNVGNDRETTINDLAALIIEMTGSHSTITRVSYEERYGKGFEDTKRRVPDVRRAEEVLGFRANVELRDGLERTLQWWRQTHK